MAEASRVVMAEVPLIFKVAAAPLDNVPEPDKAVEAVSVPELVSVIPDATVRSVFAVSVPVFVKASLTVSVVVVNVPVLVYELPPFKVRLVIVTVCVPPIALDAPVKVYNPLEEVNVVPLWVIFPPMEKVGEAELVNEPVLVRFPLIV